ncbi:ABC transporter ATP-binding protein [Sulfolobus acidocaldarius]|uniref:Copper transport ATP-binding protein n=4 Tax=Sulfolobus acidocaldarius TaxID=2285 RepID=Q4J6J0_SULAC|nr:ABC transporter ATP-binding protein [Sulfolobus acidocaldarius]AAY81591.1 copper transport ATP-binding protein [Sulfolobus acidocaldarius DSM 639]AGE72194.1 copper transport ATP-binding protein [Sulfolobus acidocaldarius N8]AGE74512.1 copper transport ATP-binding protein [Sulfolobus acidocaldarius Ron12/I]ALU29637.1 antibiotic ABC transporter ATP-binding protein [Sulfolobus acidocaldarius]ALU32370.1 antibiotic ABC transporter ATP-binding protein [Sulfolobus acidocaldarius]
MIVSEGITKKYGNRVVLNNFSLTITRGEIVTLLGPNGAGKTTFVRIVLALIRPSGGKIEIFGKDPFKDKSVFSRLGYVQELPNLPPFLTGRQVLLLSANIKGARKDEVDELLGVIGMVENADKQISKYSKGMVQRIAIAEALLGNPEILIMDEPNIGIDPIFNLNVRSLLNKLKKSGTLILMTSHDLEEVKKIADRLILINKGNKMFEGSTEELIKKFLGIRVIIEADNNAKEILDKLSYVEEYTADGEKYYVKLREDKREDLLKELVLNGVRVKSFYLDNDIERAYERAVSNA